MKILLYQWLQRKVSYFSINKSWSIFKYLINTQTEKGNILKIKKFILFIYLLYCSIKNKFIF